MIEPVLVIFDGPPGPESGRFVEVEMLSGRSAGRERAGKWRQHGAYWELGPFYADSEGVIEQSMRDLLEATEHVEKLAERAHYGLGEHYDGDECEPIASHLRACAHQYRTTLRACGVVD